MNILLTSVGRRTYLVDYFRKALDGTGYVHASNSIMTYTLSKADKYVITPQIYDDSYINFLIAYCEKEKIRAIISLFDIDLSVLAKNKERFIQHGIAVIVSDEKVVEICNDKWETYKFIRDIGLKQAASFISLLETKVALRNQEISFPLILKPRWGMGSIGIYQADTEEELDVLYKKLHRDIFNTYLKYESRADEGACIIIQAKIQGEEFGLDVFNDLNGNYVTTIAKRKLAMRAGETDIAQIVDNSLFVKIGKRLSADLKHIANLDVDCFVLDNGDIYVLELNRRFGGQYPFSHNAGVDFPRQIIEWLKGYSTDCSLITPKIGVISCKELSPVIVEYRTTETIE